MIKKILFAIAILAVVVLLGFAAKILFFPVNTAQKEIQLAYDAQDKVLDADNAIYNYEWFKQTHEDILALRNKLKNAQNNYDSYKKSLGDDRSTWTFEDKTEESRLNSVVLGLQNQLEQVIADYNARAKMATRNIFEDNVLPDYIDALTFIKE